MNTSLPSNCEDWRLNDRVSQYLLSPQAGHVHFLAKLPTFSHQVLLCYLVRFHSWFPSHYIPIQEEIRNWNRIISQFHKSICHPVLDQIWCTQKSMFYTTKSPNMVVSWILNLHLPPDLVLTATPKSHGSP